MSCTFCEIAAGEAEASIVYEDDVVYALMDIQPVTPGHLMVIPRRHAAQLADLAVRPRRELEEAAAKIREAWRWL